MNDTRNVIDAFKGKPLEDIIETLDTNGVELEIAIENTLRDFNMGTIIRSANAFGVRTIHIIGRRQWNKRGAMMTDKYLHVMYYDSPKKFADAMTARKKSIVAIDNTSESQALATSDLPLNSVLVFGQEGPGISDELRNCAENVIEIEQLGSTRSINVGVAAGIVMYEWLRRNTLT